MFVPLSFFSAVEAHRDREKGGGGECDIVFPIVKLSIYDTVISSLLVAMTMVVGSTSQARSPAVAGSRTWSDSQ